MREIKFRLWNKVNKKMIYPGNMTPDWNITLTGQIYSDGFNITEHLEIMQYTGLKDKNGKEIYEGDILKGVDPNGDFVDPFIVEWDNTWTGYLVEYNYGDWDAVAIGYDIFEFEVIGNIYEK